MCSSLLLVVGLVLISNIRDSEAVVFYAMPTALHDLDCPGEPCKPLDYYYCNSDTYFNRSNVNVTIMLMRGNHIYTSCNGMYVSIEELEKFELIGMVPASEVIVFLRTTIQLSTPVTYIGNLTFRCDVRLDPSLPPTVELVQDADEDLKQKGTSLSDTVNRKEYVTIVNGVTFDGLLIYQFLPQDSSVNFTITVINSTFLNEAGITANMKADSNDYVGKLEVIQCIFSNFTFYINYINVNLTICDSTFSIDSGSTYVMLIEYGNIMLIGRVIFFKLGDTMNGQILVLSSNLFINGNITFANNTHSPIFVFSSTVTLSGNISFVNNTGINGGAMALYSSTLNIAPNTSVYFINNTATDTGGALYVTNDKNKLLNPRFVPCFYQLLDYDDTSYNWYNIQFVNNSARNGGDDIYGENMHSCTCLAAIQPGKNGKEPVPIPTYCVQGSSFIYHTPSLSSVSSEPTRVCLCDKHGQRKCDEFQHFIEVYPGEQFSLSAVIVGADFGTTTGTVHTTPSNTTKSALKPSSHVISNNKFCTKLNFAMFSSNTNEVIYFTIKPVSLITAQNLLRQAQAIDSYCDIGMDTLCHKSVSQDNITTLTLLTIPQLVYINLVPCPLGFTLLGNPPGCECYPILAENDISCLFENRIGYHMWSGSKWLNIDDNLTVSIAQFCPFNYCNTENERKVNFHNSSDAQCSSNRHGTLCGACTANYSMAIGSSNCIHCSNSKNLMLIIYFGAAGILLVFSISVLNLTVTQGMINGLTFFANIVWAYKSILFSNCRTNAFLVFLRVLIAWINLDFGIEACFIKGLDAFWKTWLQYLFPAYIWSIAGLIIVSAKYSTKMTKLFGNRAVSVLATLFLLSYIKLLKVIVDSVGFTPIKQFNNDQINSTRIVWSLDGNYSYCHFPHILLMVAALMIFTFIWLPYTVTLLLIHLLRRISHFKILNGSQGLTLFTMLILLH